MEAGQRWRHTRGAAVDMGPTQLGAQNANLRMSMSSTTPTRTMSGRYLRNRACTRSEGWVEGGACSRSCPLSGPTASCPPHRPGGSGAPPAGMHAGAPRLVVQVLGLDRKLLGILAQHVAHLRSCLPGRGQGGRWRRASLRGRARDVSVWHVPASHQGRGRRGSGSAPTSCSP